MKIRQRKSSLKTPMLARNFSQWLAFLSCCLPHLASAQPPKTAGPASDSDNAFSRASNASGAVNLTEAHVIDLLRSQSPEAALANARSELADARTQGAGLFPNPEFSWAREAVTNVAAEDTFTLTLPISVTAPRTTRSLAASEGAWIRATASLGLTEAVRDAVLALAEAVIANERVEVLSQSGRSLAEASRVLARREAAGTASGYETIRLSIASELTQSRLAEARGAAEAAKAGLAARLGLRVDSLRLPQALHLLSDDAAVALGSAGSETLSALKQARDSERFADEAKRQATWAWLPELALSGGVKHVDVPGGTGYVVGVSLGLPLLDHGQALVAKATAQRTLSAARSGLLARRVNTELLSALASFRSALEELQRFGSRTSDEVATLLTAAQSGYLEGERSIVELLDAQRAQTDVAERRLTLLLSAKRAEARLRAAAGEFE